MISARTAQKIVTHVFFGIILSSCQEQPGDKPEIVKPRISHQTVKEKTIIVPPEVQRQWKAVKLAIIDKTEGTENIYVIPIGASYMIPPALNITIEAFLPAFTMEGSTITTSSAELINPSAKVKITESGSPVFQGWLFSKFPNTPAVTHPRFGFSLVGVIPVSK